MIGVDMPIGLPSGAEHRAADQAARRFLRTRSSTVFPAPARRLLEEREYASANARSWNELGRGLSRQTFNLLPRIREVDAAVRSTFAGRVVEVHPECSFCELAGEPLPSKHGPEGRRRRLELLTPIYGDVVASRPRGAAAHDVLDAFAVLWSTERFALGAHVERGDGRRDEAGLEMRIVT